MPTLEKPLIDVDAFIQSLGFSPEDLPKTLPSGLSGLPGPVRKPTQEERDGFLLSVLKRLGSEWQKRSEEENLNAFETGWSQNLERCRTEGVTAETLRPGYIKPYPMLRQGGDWVIAESAFYLDQMLSIATACSFTRYLGDAETIYEFGCGTGRYLLALSEIFPQKRLFGTDWAEASVEILELMRLEGRKVEGTRFDMLNPPADFRLRPDSAVVTIGALEQLGDRCGNFLNYLLENRPALVMHHEPIVEFYSEDNLIDWLAIQYCTRRGYLKGWWPALQELERQGRIEILEGRRMGYGDPYHEIGSFIVWRPR